MVKQGNRVEILFVGRLKDGSVFDLSERGHPLSFHAGSRTVIEGLSKGVIGMRVGEKKRFQIKPEQAYGKYDKKLLVKVPREKVPKSASEGDVLSDEGNKNQDWSIKTLTKEFAVLDGNHPLAGQTLFMEIELVSIRA